MADNNKTGRSTRKRRGKRQSSVEDVTVEVPFSLSVPEGLSAAKSTESSKSKAGGDSGDGCYVSATVNNRRYYGVLVEQTALKAASLLHFQDEANSLDLNRRMKMLKQRTNSIHEEQDDSNSDSRSNGHDGSSNGNKRQLAQSHNESEAKRSKKTTDVSLSSSNEKPVQKFRYIDSADSSTPGYRILLATYADVNAASEDKEKKAQLIEKACENGGDFVGEYYYQYEILHTTLQASKNEKRTDVGFRTSLGMDSFLRNTSLPIWFPLSNIAGGQDRVLNLLKMKKAKGGIHWDSNSLTKNTTTDSLPGNTLPPLEPRKCFRVGIIGGGISGLACAHELFRKSDRRIDLEVVLLEGRKRVGGRLCTDETTFTLNNGKTPFPVDLGASWIHGIDHNPLAALAKEAGVDFISSSEEVRMFESNAKEVDNNVDEKMGKLFDDLLDQASEDAWKVKEFVPEKLRHQKAVRWYASVLKSEMESAGADQETTEKKERGEEPEATDASIHRRSSDVTVDHAIGKVISSSKIHEFSKMSKTQHSLLLWNTKNVEYANGANINDLSMKFMDSDDRHAFEGEHVLLKQGYSSVAHHLFQKLNQKGDKFKCVLDFQVGKIEYARQSESLPYIDFSGRNQKCVELTDTCCVTSRKGDQNFKFDFLVCTLPLGVLKNSVSDDKHQNKVTFHPPLPDPKIDVINTVGFGLLNKVYLQFPFPFWRVKGILDDDQTLFGNATGYNPHHYMFFDVGKSLIGADGPSVLMTLISGVEAVRSERMSHEELVADVMTTLRRIFSHRDIPDPIPVRTKTTRWGSDEFARGSYSFLPPGATDEDFAILQSPVNGNGDSLLLESNETMRLFWAGEHTTSLHPSTAHGAMLSGIRAAAEVMDAMNVNYSSQLGIDKLIPMSVFRSINPTTSLQCGICNLAGSRTREGSLLAFQHGSRQILAHNNCAEYSPEVEVREGKWKNVIKAVNRGKQIICTLCRSPGATIGCTEENCLRSFHFSCCEDTGWRFKRDGKVFYCDLHRSAGVGKPKSISDCDRISISFFRAKYPNAVLKCGMCGEFGDDPKSGALLAFQGKFQDALLHDKCVRHTNIVVTIKEDSIGGLDEFHNIFAALNGSGVCSICSRYGATVKCSDPACPHHFHFRCAETEWDFNKKKDTPFKCVYHRTKPSNVAKSNIEGLSNGVVATMNTNNGGISHSLFSHTLANGSQARSPNIASNAAIGSAPRSSVDLDGKTAESGQHENMDSDDENMSSDDESENKMTCPLSCDLPATEMTGLMTYMVRVQRASCQEQWDLSFSIGSSVLPPAVKRLYIESCSTSHALKKGDLVVSLNKMRIGSNNLKDLQQVLSYLDRSISVVVEFLREGPAEISCDPVVSYNQPVFTVLQRPHITFPWSVSLSVGEEPGSKRKRLLVSSSSAGLNQGDIVISINGIKVGSQYLKDLDKVIGFMNSSIKLSIEHVRLKEIEGMI